jgi:glycyl-tRNA synthetase beta chain
MNSDLLLELGCEDLPARYVVPLANALSSGITAGLKKRGVASGEARTYATPRRIAVIVNAVEAQQPDQQIERFGPAITAALKDGQPTPAALGFAKSCGVEFSAIGQKDGKLHYAKSATGKKTVELIPEIFEETLKQMDELVPKRMRWGSGSETFVRPVQWIVALLGNEVIPLKRFDLTAGRKTYGHRFHAPAAIELKSPAEYADKLKAAHVWADVASRKANIKQQIEAEAKKLGGTARITDDLLDEVTALVEWPVVISGRMEERFMQLPAEAIIATVETNQRYFTVFAGDKLLPVFITISNIESKDVSQVIEGNERVVRPRLTDALFFWEQDLKQPLSAYGDKLKTVTFQKELGSIGDKVTRIGLLATHIADLLGEDVKTVERAALLCKNDLVTKMVYEIPELQGVMGGYYAEKFGESAAVAKAIREHYLPTQQGTPIPSTREGQIVALADKLDTLVSIFAIGMGPSASKDPFALKRMALGISRICVEGNLRLDMEALSIFAAAKLPIAVLDRPLQTGGAVENALSLISDRYFNALESEGISVHIISTVRSTQDELSSVDDSRAYNFLDLQERVEAVRHEADAVARLGAAHKRVRNLLKQAGDANTGSVNVKLLVHAAEQMLHSKMTELTKLSAKASYAEKLKNLATLREPVDAFFDGVMVNDKDEAIRNNRLALLRQLDALCREVADISLLPG